MDTKTWLALWIGGGIAGVFGLIAALLQRQTGKEANITAAQKLEQDRQAHEDEEGRKYREEMRQDLEECHKRQDSLQSRVDVLMLRIDTLVIERDNERDAHRQRVLLCQRVNGECHRNGEKPVDSEKTN